MAPEVPAARAPVSLHEKLEFLSHPAAYPESPACVELRETHLSYVFLTPTSAYKMKKPVAHEYADLRTLEGRHANCRAEVQLNRRLAPEVYLGLVALTQGDNFELVLGGGGTVVEWLVSMQRLPAELMLDDRLRRGLLQRSDVVALARRLGAFYSEQPAVELRIDRYLALLRRQLDVSRQLLASPEFALPPGTLAGIFRTLGRYLDDGRELAARVLAGRIVEGHGDLRPEHVCLSTPPVIIDCLEFSRDLRLLDPFDEIAFLGLECARMHAPWVGPLLRRSMQTILNDRPGPRPYAFYTGLRACVRARLALAHLQEAVVRTPDEWLPRARDYLERAVQACKVIES